MGTREDLLAAGGALASSASAAALAGKPITYESIRIAHLVEGSRAALEAAALVDAEPAPIIAAAERLSARLNELGVETDIGDAAAFGAAEAIDAVAQLVERVAAIARTANGVGRAYARLQVLCEALERDFSASDSETAKRLAARVGTAIQDARAELGAETTNGGPDGG